MFATFRISCGLLKFKRPPLQWRCIRVQETIMAKDLPGKRSDDKKEVKQYTKEEQLNYLKKKHKLLNEDKRNMYREENRIETEARIILEKIDKINVEVLGKPEAPTDDDPIKSDSASPAGGRQI